MQTSTQNTCGQCEHYRPEDPIHAELSGRCALDGDADNTDFAEEGSRGWNKQGYVAGVYVGSTLGCINWEKKL
ncbi:MAG: hypothetical protein ABIQ90_01480 [Polaromonas sp.]